MSKTLLLADGSITIQRVIELTFAHEDVRVISIADGRRAVQWLNGDKPDIVLADVDLPEMDGYALAAHIRKTPRLKKIPVLLLAGAFEPVDQARMRAAGCDGVIVKPFEPQHVVARVRELLDGEPEPVGVGSRESGSKASSAAPSASMPSNVSPIRPHGQAGGESPAPQARGLDPLAPLHEAPALRLEPLAPAPERLEAPTRPIWDPGGSTQFPAVQPLRPEPLPMAHAPAPPPAPPKVSLANAFSALLAAEQSTLPQPPAAPAAPAPVNVTVSDASVEEAVRKVLVKMTDDLIRRIVIETAERLIREEIEKIKSIPE